MNQILSRIQRELLLQEAFANFEYHFPKSDFEEQLYDFYFFSQFINGMETNDVKFNYAFDDAVRDCVNALTKEMLYALKYAIISVIAYSFIPTPEKHMSKVSTQVAKMFQKEVRAKQAELEKQVMGWTDNTDWNYKVLTNIQNKLKLTDADMGKIFLEYFKKVWDDDLWRSICKCLVSLAEADNVREKSVWIDQAYNIEHHSGSIFTKNEKYNDMHGGTEWLKRALNWKKDNRDIRGFYERVSSQLKPIVAYVAKNVHGTTMAGKDEHRGGTRKGKWTGGIWEKGIWQSGIWENGEWKTGFWVSGTHLNGTWNDGKWMSGTWKGGTWKDGQWKDGTWEKGIWEKGQIYSKKYSTWMKSSVNPKKFYELQEQSKTKAELQQEVSKSI